MEVTMAKLAFGSQLRGKMLEGVKETAQIIVPNYGPSGKNTIVEPQLDVPMAMRSGARILEDFSLENPLMQMGAALLCKGAKGVGGITGDGVTATVVLCRAMLEAGEKLLAAGVNPIPLRRGMEKAAEAAIQGIWDAAIPADEDAIPYKVAFCSSNDETAAQILAEAYSHAGKDGIITIEDTQERNTRLRYGGIQYDYGLAASEFANDEQGTTAKLWNPYVLLVDKKIEDIYELQTILEQVSRKKVPLLIITKDIKQEALRIILMNVKRKAANVVVATAPGHGDSRRRHMEALAARLGSVLIDDQCGLELRHCGLELCGRVEAAQIGRNHTLLTGIPNANPEMVEILKRRTRRLLEETSDSYEIEKLQLTLSILAGQIVTVLVGGVSEIAMFEQKYLLENALSAVRTAQETGILPGGGKGFLLGVPTVRKLMDTLEGEEYYGAQCIEQALLAPVKTIAENVGVSGSVVVNHLLSETRLSYGFDAAKQEYTDLFQRGILDPAGTIVGAVSIAAETAATLLTVEAAVYG